MPALLLRCKNKRSAEKAKWTPPCPSALISSEHFTSCVWVFRACVHCRQYRGFWVCVCVASPLGSAGRCSSQTAGTEGRIKFGSRCNSSRTRTEEPRIQSFLFHSLSFLCFSLYYLFLFLSAVVFLAVQLNMNLHLSSEPPSGQHTPIKCPYDTNTDFVN